MLDLRRGLLNKSVKSTGTQIHVLVKLLKFARSQFSLVFFSKTEQ